MSADIKKTLGSKLWRLDNLYKIIDKNQQLVTMRLNDSQKKILTEFKHNRKIILKSRQQGVSTLFVAYYLDSCLFTSNFFAGIQSYGLEESRTLRKKALTMLENIPKEVLTAIGVKIQDNNASTLSFSNGSVFKVGNFRGSTLHGLHVSEYAKIAKMFPAKALELKSGAFQAVPKSGKITIESTAEGTTGEFYNLWNKSVAKASSLGSIDFQPIFLPWTIDIDCTTDEVIEPNYYQKERLAEVYREVPDLVLTDEQINWFYMKVDELGDSFNQEYPITPEMAFSQPIEGTFFGMQYTGLEEEGRIGDYGHVEGHKVIVAFDLGVRDHMALIFAQIIEGVVRIINCVLDKDVGITYYCELLDKMRDNLGYDYGTIILPHDATVRSANDAVTRVQTFHRCGYPDTKTLDVLPFKESINAGRQLIDSCVIDAEGAEDVILGIKLYRRKYDRNTGFYLDTDVHDIHSNTMASFRYLAQGIDTFMMINRSTILNNIAYNSVIY